MFSNILKMSILMLLVAIVSAFAQVFDLGKGFNYEMTTSILLGESPKSQLKKGSTGNVGFQLTQKLSVLPIWKDPTDSAGTDTYLLSIKTDSPQLWIMSRKAPNPEGFVEHNSRLEEISKDPVLVLWKNGQILKVFSIYTESLSSLNLKRGIASIFQYRAANRVVQEKDASGSCNVTYKMINPRSIEKVKTSCQKHKIEQSNPILGVEITSNYEATYRLTNALLPDIVEEEEKHEMNLIARPEARTSITTNRTLQLVPGTVFEDRITASTYTEVLKLLDSRYIEVSIEAENEKVGCPESGCLTLNDLLDNSHSSLETSTLGTIKSASTFLKLVPVIRNTSTETLTKILKSPRYHDILPQLYDLYGSASTFAAHQAAMKALKHDEIGDNTERYLWAVSMSPYPDPDIIKDVLKRSEETLQNDKVSETYALSAAAMAKRYNSPSVIEKVKNSLELGLESCTGDECRMKFLRALGNLASKTVLPTLLKYTTNNSRAMGVIAWKAIASLDSTVITKEVKSLAMKIFLQLTSHKVDSSIRTLALNIILENDPSIEVLQDLLIYLSSQDPVYEVKKYLLQRIEQLIATNEKFYLNYKEAVKRESKRIMNYNTLAQNGLSTAFTRTFLRSTGSNGSLVTIQEISSGLLKRGIVDVVLESGSHKYTIFSLGLFAGGLGSFVSSSNQDDNEIPTDNEPATAGMEISFLDVTIRPFVFFSGQGELMGHVWSGTASDRTSAFQTTVNLHRHREFIPLSSGFVVDVDVEGAMSVDLAGHIKLSLWSRNAQSLVEMGAGIAVQGTAKILTDFVQSQAEFSLNLEPKLELATDVDFSGPVSLCMRLSQPDTTKKHLIYKVERIPGSRHKLRKTRRIKYLSPAKSYLLNKKNNEMCSKIFTD